MRINDLLALSHVNRWSIVPRLREQSVADHTFRVMAIAVELVYFLPITAPSQYLSAMFVSILFHDAAESRSGDIPTPAKEAMGLREPVELCPWLADCDPYATLPDYLKKVMDLADKIEAYTWIKRYGAGAHARKAEDYMMKKIVGATPIEWQSKVITLIASIVDDLGR